MADLANRMALSDLVASTPQIGEALSKIIKDAQRRQTVLQEALQSKAKGEKKRKVLSEAHRGMSKFLSRRREFEDIENKVRLCAGGTFCLSWIVRIAFLLIFQIFDVACFRSG